MTSTTFRLSPLIRITLLSLYTALTAPLPILSQVTSSPVPPTLLWVGIGLGAIALYAALSERVVLSDRTISVTYPFAIALCDFNYFSPVSFN